MVLYHKVYVVVQEYLHNVYGSGGRGERQWHFCVWGPRWHQGEDLFIARLVSASGEMASMLLTNINKPRKVHQQS